MEQKVRFRMRGADGYWAVNLLSPPAQRLLAHLIRRADRDGVVVLTHADKQEIRGEMGIGQSRYNDIQRELTATGILINDNARHAWGTRLQLNPHFICRQGA